MVLKTIGSRIKQRRIELGISVDELASRLGKNRATIYRYESDEIENFPIAIIGPLAKVLQVSPAYLMGWNLQDKNADIWDSSFRSSLTKAIDCVNCADADATHLIISRLSDIASETCNISLSEACSIADELGMSLDEMVGLNKEKSALNSESGLDLEIINLIISLPENKKGAALDYLRYLSGRADN